MDDNLALLALTVVTLATALNLFLVVRLAAIVRAGAEAALPRTVPIGQAMPPFEGRRHADGRLIISGELSGQPAVLVFLSPGCGHCREKAAELLGILPAMRDAGLALWVIPADDRHDIFRLVGGTPLMDHVVVLDAATRLTLNPRKAAPFYLFLDEAQVVRASNYIGDPDWQSFVEQMREKIR